VTSFGFLPSALILIHYLRGSRHFLRLRRLARDGRLVEAG